MNGILSSRRPVTKGLPLLLTLIIAANQYGESTLESPVISPDGTLATYWKITLVSSGSGSSIRQSKDLYLIQRTPAGWSAPRRITATSVVPGAYVDGPAGMDASFNRMAYSRSYITGDVMYGASLELAELAAGGWTIQSLTTPVNSIWHLYPSFSQDGRTILYQGTDPAAPGCNAFWAMKTGETNSLPVQSISGTVALAGQPLPGVAITLGGAATAGAETDKRGQYGLTGLASGAYTVTPTLSGFTFTPASLSLTLTGSGAAGKDFTAANAAGTVSFAGSVQDTNPRPMADAVVEVVGQPSLSARTDSAGDFLLAGIPAATDFSLKVTYPASAWYLPAYSATYRSSANIRTAVPFILHGEMDFSNYKFYGAVAEGKVASAGSPTQGLAGAAVTCTSTKHPEDCATAYGIVYHTGTAIGGTATSDNGLYYLYGLEEGDQVTVTATKAGWQIPQATGIAHADGVGEWTVLGSEFGPWDLNGNGAVDLGDAVQGMQILSRLPMGDQQVPPGVLSGGGTIGLGKVIYILQRAAALRD